MKSHLKSEDRNKVGFYCLINKTTGETYSGSGTLEQCWYRHYNGYTNGNHSNEKLRKAFIITPDGWEFFPYTTESNSISKKEAREIAFNIEQNDIDSFLGDNLFLNISSSSRNCRPVGIETSEETREKMRQAHKKRWDNYPEEVKEIKRQVFLENTLPYQSLLKENGTPKETKEKQSQARLELFKNGYTSYNHGTKITDEQNRKLQEGKDKWRESLSEEEKDKIKKRLVSFLPGNTFSVGRKESPESKEKRLAKTIGLKRSEESIENIKRGKREHSNIRFTVDGKHYACYTDAANDYGVNLQTVINRLNSNSEKFNNWILLTI